MTAPGSARLAGAFRDTAASYKYFWFLALLEQLPALGQPVPLRQVLAEMVVGAWTPVARYRLSLGPQDRLQKIIDALRAASGLEPRASLTAVRRAIDRWPEGPAALGSFARYVPGHFLSAWYPGAVGHLGKDRQARALLALAAADPGAVPYVITGEAGERCLHMSPGWRAWLIDHAGVVRGFTEQALIRYLQTRNPSVPGIVDKLHPPRRRALARARAHWLELSASAAAAGTPITDIYTDQPLEAAFDVDHFLPWSFVAHDLFWNLAPVNAATNRAKGDAIPELERYLPRLASLHARILPLACRHRTLADSYAALLGGTPVAPVSAAHLLSHLEATIRPLAAIAEGQGFPSGWRP